MCLLLERGADYLDTDIMGNDALITASIMGRIENVKFWLNTFPDWDVNRKNTVLGGSALGSAVFMGPRRMDLVRVLIDRGASRMFLSLSLSSLSLHVPYHTYSHNNTHSRFENTFWSLNFN